jgi:hypothetical protein
MQVMTAKAVFTKHERGDSERNRDPWAEHPEKVNPKGASDPKRIPVRQ